MTVRVDGLVSERRVDGGEGGGEKIGKVQVGFPSRIFVDGSHVVVGDRLEGG